MAWYKKRKSLGKGTQVCLPSDCLVSVSELDVKKRGCKEIDAYNTRTKWKRQKIADEPSRKDWTLEQWDEEWQGVLDDPLANKMWSRGQWLIGEFEGVLVERGQSNTFQGSMAKTERSGHRRPARAVDAASAGGGREMGQAG